MNVRRVLSVAVLSLTLGMGFVSAGPLSVVASAQARGPKERIVKGKVTNKDGAPVKGAVVYLRDDRTSSVKSAISTDDGTYRFVQLSQGVDYDLWAQIDQKKSKTKSISSFDSKNEFNLDLQIDL